MSYERAELNLLPCLYLKIIFQNIKSVVEAILSEALLQSSSTAALLLSLLALELFSPQ